MLGKFILDWWPVGQGLFSSGTIMHRKGAKPLTWVYDCGTISEQEILNKSIDKFAMRQKCFGTRKINLATISHFDQDHISGFVRLVERFQIDTLLLPYIPLWQRLIIAIEQGITTEDEIFGFFRDPAGFLLSIEGSEIRRVVYVPSSGPEGPTSDAPDGPEEGPDDLSGGLLKIDFDSPPKEANGDPAATRTGGREVRFLKRFGRIYWPKNWEFVPYNDAELAPKVSDDFLAAAAPLIETLRTDPTRGKDALTQLKKLYDKQFGSSREMRNLVSLFLYSGPLGPRSPKREFHPSQAVNIELLEEGFSQMHTGDGTLDKGSLNKKSLAQESRYDAFARFFTVDDRLARSKIFQVMHHGAKGNSHTGIAAALRPAVSVFSSDPARGPHHHPHQDVWQDFLPYHPTQVDLVTGFSLHGYLWIR